MNPLLSDALAQADQLISAALGRPCPVKSRLSPRNTISSPAPLALKLDAPALERSLDVTGSWFSAVRAENGYLNFILSQQWYQAAVQQLPLSKEDAIFLPVPVAFPAEIHPFDWQFLTILNGKTPAPSLAARQDRENAGWLVRYTLQRLKTLEPQAAEALQWTKAERQLLLSLASFSTTDRPRRQAAALLALSGMIWEVTPQKLPKALNQYGQRILQSAFLLDGAVR